MELKQITELLKEHEPYCYRIAYYLLQQEESSLLATKQALLELGSNECFYMGNKDGRSKLAKKVTTKHSIRLALVGG